MFYYFGYGSNMDLTSLKAKGAIPVSSFPACLDGWKLCFNVEHFFKHEGGMGNIEYTGRAGDRVLGVAHLLNDASLSNLDEAEAYGIGYDRIEVPCVVDGKTQNCFAYVGFPSFINNACKPTRRYLNILVNGARNAGLDADYVGALEQHQILKKRNYPAFNFPAVPDANYNAISLSRHPTKTAIAGAVFDMSKARKHHEYVKTWFGAKDMTLFHLKRMDTSTGNEALEDIANDRLDEKQRLYLNEYLHEFNDEYEFAGRFFY